MLRLHFHLWLMQLPVWRYFGRAAADRVTEAEAEQYRDAKTRSEFGVFRPHDEADAPNVPLTPK